MYRLTALKLIQLTAFVLVFSTFSACGIRIYGSGRPDLLKNTRLLDLKTVDHVRLLDEGLLGTESERDAYTASFSPDGSMVVFETQSSNLEAGDGNGNYDIYVRTLLTGVTTRISRTPIGDAGNDRSVDASFSPDSRSILFNSVASDLVLGDTNANWDVFIYHLDTHITERVSTNVNGVEANNATFEPAFRPDDEYIVFESWASNLIPGDSNLRADIFVKNLSTKVVTRISTSSAGAESNGHSYTPAISNTAIAFVSDADNLVALDTNGVKDIFIKKLSGETIRVSTASDGTQGNGDSTLPVFSPDGLKIAFVSSASNLVGGDTNGVPDIFIKTIASGEIIRITTSSLGVEGNDVCGSFAFSPDGQRIAFASRANNLVDSDINGDWDIFVKTISDGKILLVSTSSQGATQSNGSSEAPHFSADGSQIVYISTATNLESSGLTGSYQHVFITDLIFE